MNGRKRVGSSFCVRFGGTFPPSAISHSRFFPEMGMIHTLVATEIRVRLWVSPVVVCARGAFLFCDRSPRPSVMDTSVLHGDSYPINYLVLSRFCFSLSSAASLARHFRIYFVMFTSFISSRF